MKRKRFWLFSVLILTAAPGAFAQTDTAEKETTKSDTATLVDERVAFVKTFYMLNADQITKLRESLSQRVNAHDDYMNKNELTIRRRATAISMAIPQEREIDAKTAAELRMKYQNEIYAIHEAAPLSLTLSVKSAEDMLDQNGRNAGRAKIEKFFAKQLNGRPLDPAQLDRLVLAPVESLDVSPTESLTSVNQKQMGKEPVSTPSNAKDPDRKMVDREAKLEAARMAAIRSKALAAQNQKEPEGPPPPPSDDRRAGKVALKAPALDQWESAYQSWATGYEFAPEQRQVAQSIYEQTIERARKAAGENGDAKQLDDIFNQMKQRIDSVASVEQRERFEAGSNNKETAKGGDAPDKKS